MEVTELDVLQVLDEFNFRLLADVAAEICEAKHLDPNSEDASSIADEARDILTLLLVRELVRTERRVMASKTLKPGFALTESGVLYRKAILIKEVAPR